MSGELTQDEVVRYTEVINNLLAKKNYSNEDNNDVHFFAKALRKYGYPVPGLQRKEKGKLGERILSAFETFYPHLDFSRRSSNTAMAKRKLFVYLVHKRGLKPVAIMHALNDAGKRISMYYITYLIDNYKIGLLKIDELEQFNEYFKGVEK